MSDIQRLEVPKWGLSMEEGTVTKWLISVGDSFNEGDEVCELETSKITNVLEAPFSGVLRKIVAEPGETLPVGALMGLCADSSISDEEIDAASAGAAPAQEADAASSGSKASAPGANADKPAQAVQAAQPSGSGEIPEQFRGNASDEGILATDHARAFASEHGIDLSVIEGSGRRERISVDDIRNAINDAGGTAPGFGQIRTSGGGNLPNSAVRATPAARKLADENGISLAALSNGAGRVEREDVARAIARGGAGHGDLGSAQTGAVRSEPLSNMRKTIAKRLQKSKQDAPHYRVVMDVEIDALMKLRKSINESGARVTVNDFLVKAGANALMAHPEINVQFDGEQVTHFASADVGVAVAIDNGLVSPVLQGVDRMGLVEISRGVRDLATRAKTGQLKLEEIEGGTFSISNLGMFGVSQFDAIINPPQVSILAVGKGQKKLLPGRNGPREATVLALSLSSDHRVIDGAVAAQFLSTLKDYLEVPGRMLS